MLSRDMVFGANVCSLCPKYFPDVAVKTWTTVISKCSKMAVFGLVSHGMCEDCFVVFMKNHRMDKFLKDKRRTATMFKEGWYEHPKLGVIKIFRKQGSEHYFYRLLRKRKGRMILLQSFSMTKAIWSNCQPTSKQKEKEVSE